MLLKNIKIFYYLFFYRRFESYCIHSLIKYYLIFFYLI
uniref:Uncharacterized protein n=1 Tax=Siphoviridae sp. ct8Ri8 TaxID=2826170 RepID=A0A8S5MT23_9CAUD|nr:MAG TPA: hypothetical protein [Siphoviridae sp. ct8Ri8]